MSKQSDMWAGLIAVGLTFYFTKSLHQAFVEGEKVSPGFKKAWKEYREKAKEKRRSKAVKKIKQQPFFTEESGEMPKKKKEITVIDAKVKKITDHGEHNSVLVEWDNTEVIPIKLTLLHEGSRQGLLWVSRDHAKEILKALRVAVKETA